MSWGLLLIVALGFTAIPLVTSTPEQRIYAARIIRRAMELAHCQQKVIALSQNGKAESQWTRELQGAGRIDVALLLACPTQFLRALAQAIGEAAGADPQVEILAEAVADRVTARLASVKVQMVRASLAREEAACQ